MSTITVRVDEKQKQAFQMKAKQIGVDTSTIFRLFMDKFIHDDAHVKLEIEDNLTNEVLQIGENSFSEVWDNEEDDVYAKLYKNV